jgi:3-isopropylmalate dehydrogenase
VKRSYAIVPGDGIGVEVCREAVRVLQAAVDRTDVELTLESFPFGADHFLATGETLPPGAIDRFRTFDAILMGAFGDARVPDMKHARDILLGTRFELDLFANIRPVKCPLETLNPLKFHRAEEIDFVVFRENTEGAYVGIGGVFKRGTADEVAIQEDVNTRKGVERIIRLAFEFARREGRRRVTMSDKSNAMRFGHDLWQRTFREIAAEYSDIEADHYYIDALVMEMVRDPGKFDVVVTSNLFGDIATDLGASLQGGMGMAVSGNVHPGRTSMFEPVHGSAPDIAGADVANPFGAMLTAAMMLDHTGVGEAARRIERAVVACLQCGDATADVGGVLGTVAAGDAVLRRIEEQT